MIGHYVVQGWLYLGPRINLYGGSDILLASALISCMHSSTNLIRRSPITCVCFLRQSHEYVLAQDLFAMHVRFIAFVFIAALLNVTATPYFKPWIETRQAPTPGPVGSLIYPPGADSYNCPAAATNLWAPYPYLNAPNSNKRRSIHSRFRVAQPRSRRLRLPRQQVNASCQEIGSFSFSDWEQGATANTPTVTIPGGYIYTFSMAANVIIQQVVAWTVPTNSNKFSQIGSTTFGNYTGTMVVTPKDQVNIHWEIKFQFGHPNGNVALFTNQGPGSAMVSTSKRKKK